MTIDSEHRQRKELFVSHHNGTTLFETGSVVINICASYFLCQIIKSRLSLVPWQNQSIFNYLLEFMILIVPMTLVSTVMSNYSSIFHYVLWLTALIVYMSDRNNKHSSVVKRPTDSVRSQLIEIFRGQIFLVTCLCILAVDFTIFPRRFAKTEDFGYSGMDLGVGLFALAHGMVSTQARNKPNRWKDFFLENIILFALGLVRLVLIKSVNYVEHVSEYGVHWNFFLTLSLMKLIGILLMEVIQNLWILLPMVALFHEFITVQYFQSESPNRRDNFIDANREGIFSLPGYVCLYLIGVFIGRFIISRERLKQYRSISLYMFIAMVVLCAMNFRPSRKLCNFGYISSTTGLACMCLSCFSLTHYLFLRRNYLTESSLLKHVNQKGLDAFLFANILTGIVNLSIQTIDTWPLIALSILFFYMICVTLFAYFLSSPTKSLIKLLK